MPMTMTMLDIYDTSKYTGLSSSVLRIWELRHGWPLPERLPNGYRCYPHHLVEDLKRAAECVKAGIPVRKLIVDGFPRWPSTKHVAPPMLAEARALPAPSGKAEAQLREELLAALAELRPTTVHHLLERVFWTVRPRDEVLTALAPALVAIGELQRDARPLVETDAILDLICHRCDALIRMLPKPNQPLLIVPARECDRALAALAALALSYRGFPAMRCDRKDQPRSSCLVMASVGDSSWRRHQLAALSLLAREDGRSIADLVDTARPLAWLTSLLA